MGNPFGNKNPNAQEGTPSANGEDPSKKDLVFVCFEDCYQDQTFYRAGQTLTGKTCPPHFKVKGPVQGENKK